MTPPLARLLPRLLVVVVALSLRLGAQDATVSPFQWEYPDDEPPDSLPVFRHDFRPEFPRELRRTTEIGYVTEQVFVDDHGRASSVMFYASSPAFHDSLTKEQGNWNGDEFWRFRPALRAAKPVNALIHFCVVFNPASATAAGPEATPRLLVAHEVTVPGDIPTGEDGPGRSAVVWATVTIDAQGRPGNVSGVAPVLVPFVTKGLAKWVFAPARHAGVPVAADLRVPFVITHGEYGLAKDKIPPRCIKQVRPEYPISMRQSGMRGEEIIQFEVDVEGRVRHPFVARSLNPAFDAPALEAVSAWRFEPGRLNGLPVRATMQVPIVFALNLREEGGSDGTEILQRGDPTKLSDEVRVDVAPKIRFMVVSVYPYPDLLADKSGGADVVYAVDEQGNVVASRVDQADQPEFGLALQAAVERFLYVPGLRDGRPHRTVLRFHQEFHSDDLNLVGAEEFRLMRLERKHPERIAKAGGTDQPIKLVGGRPASFPLSLFGKVPGGSATVEFLVDEHGHARLPRVVDASAPEFGYAAVAAVALWTFEAPTAKGEPVVVRVRAPFIFK
jgi:TonB family protein